MAYEYIVIVHLVCAIFFLGAIATEVLVLAPIHRYISTDQFRKIEFLMFRQIRRTYPLFLLPLYGTGFWMYSVQMEGYESFAAFLGSTFGILLTLKLGLALGLASVFVLAPFLFMPKAVSGQGFKKVFMHFLIVTAPEEKFKIERFDGIHYLAFGLGVAIVILAKLMFIL